MECYEFTDPRFSEFLKPYAGFMVLIVVILGNAFYWSKRYIGWKNGYEKKYSFIVNALHPFKSNKPRMSKNLKMVYRAWGIALAVFPNIFLIVVVFSKICM